MFKKIIAVVLVVALTAAASIAGTMAYLQDQDEDVNVMTLGNVKIVQHEYQRATNENGYETKEIDGVTSYVLEAFEQAKPLYPIVGDPSTGAAGWDDTVVRMTQVGSYGSMQVFAGKNAQDKFVTVENTGKSDAYVRTIVAIEVGSANAGLIGTSYHTTWTESEIGTVAIDGNNYFVIEYAYNGGELSDGTWRHANGILPAGDTSYPNLSQIYLKSVATNEDCEKLDGNGNGTLDVLVLSQAVQADGFANAKTALDTAFGAVNATNAAEWFGGMEAPIMVATLAEMQAAIEADKSVVMTADITGDLIVVQKPDVKINIAGNGHTFAGVITVDGKSGTYTTAGLTIENVNFKADSISADACINLGKKDDNNTRYTCNVTVSNCTFDVSSAVGVKSYTGGDKNLTITGCTATANAHSLVQAKGIDGVRVDDCKVNSKNGLNFNNSDNVTVSGCTVDTKGYAVRFGESSGGVGAAETYRIENCTLKSDNDDGDATIILRGTADYATLTIVNTTITGTPDIANTATGATVVK